MMTLIKLFIEFFKTGLFAVGGGLATLPFLKDISDKTNWYTHADLANMVAISESTPGPIGVNMATYVGNTTAGVLGGLVATIGLITPSIIVILVVSSFLEKYKDNRYVQGAFYGLRAASTALIASAFISIVNMSLINISAINISIFEVFNFFNIFIAILLYYGIKKYNYHPIVYLFISAVVGIIFKL